MNNLLKILFGAGLAVTLTSCGAVQDAYGNNPNNYPNNYPNSGSTNGTVYRTNDGQVYRQGDVYRDRNGNVYQNGRVIKTGDVYGQPGVLGRNGNQTVYNPNQNRQNLPPGQAKKIYGGKATDYAKGQQKKRDNQWQDRDNDDNDDRKDRNHKHYKKSKNKGYKN